MELLPITRYNPTTGPILYRSLIANLEILKVDSFYFFPNIFLTGIDSRYVKIHRQIVG